MRTYSLEFKLMVVEAVREEGYSYRKASEIFSVGKNAECGKNQIKYWDEKYSDEMIAEYKESGANPKPLKPREARMRLLADSEKADLIRKNEQLKLENEYLKKLHALALSKIKLENGTKPE